MMAMLMLAVAVMRTVLMLVAALSVATETFVPSSNTVMMAIPMLADPVMRIVLT